MRASSRSRPSDKWRRVSTPTPTSGRPAAGCRPAPRTPPGSGGWRANTTDSKSLPAIRPMSPQVESASRSSTTAPRRPPDARPSSTQAYASAVEIETGGVSSSAGAEGRGGSRSNRSPCAQAERERRTREKERNVAAELGRELQQLVAGNGIAGEPVHREQRGRRVARAAAQTRAHRNPLGRAEVHGEAVSGRRKHRGRRANREVVGGGTHSPPLRPRS